MRPFKILVKIILGFLGLILTPITAFSIYAQATKPVLPEFEDFTFYDQPPYGIHAASHFYFGTFLSRLLQQKAITLVALLRARENAS